MPSPSSRCSLWLQNPDLVFKPVYFSLSCVPWRPEREKGQNPSALNRVTWSLLCWSRFLWNCIWVKESLKTQSHGWGPDSTLWVWSELVIWGIHVFGPQFPQQSQMVSVCVLCQCYEDEVDQIENLENSREPGMVVAHACHLTTQKVGTSRSQTQGQPRLHSEILPQKKKIITIIQTK